MMLMLRAKWCPICWSFLLLSRLLRLDALKRLLMAIHQMHTIQLSLRRRLGSPGSQIANG